MGGAVWEIQSVRVDVLVGNNDGEIIFTISSSLD
jgi:hypothetical protein